MGIGYKLKKLIEEKNTNVNALANRAKVKPTTLYSIIDRDNTKVDIDVLIAIAKVLGVPVEYFSDNYVPTDPNTDPETMQLAAMLKDKPGLVRVARLGKDLSEDDLKQVAQYTEFLAAKNEGAKLNDVDDDL